MQRCPPAPRLHVLSTVWISLLRPCAAQGNGHVRVCRSTECPESWGDGVGSGHTCYTPAVLKSYPNLLAALSLLRSLALVPSV